MRRLYKFLQDEDGPTVVEYAVLLAGIVAVCAASISAVGGGSNAFWQNNRVQLDSAFSSGS